LEDKHQGDRRLPKYPKFVEKRTGISMLNIEYKLLIIN